MQQYEQNHPGVTDEHGVTIGTTFIMPYFAFGDKP